MRRLSVFDLVSPTAVSKSALGPRLVTLLDALLVSVRRTVTSRGSRLQLERQLLAGHSDPVAGDHVERLSLTATSGPKFFESGSTWKLRDAEPFDEHGRRTMIAALQPVVGDSAIETRPTWGAPIEGRGGQITLPALGQEAPRPAKQQRDPDSQQRERMRAGLAELAPEYSARLGGMTSNNVTRSGVDEAYGLRKLRDIPGIALGELRFLIDALLPGGNDDPVQQVGVPSTRVRDPEQSQSVIRILLGRDVGTPEIHEVGP